MTPLLTLFLVLMRRSEHAEFHTKSREQRNCRRQNRLRTTLQSRQTVLLTLPTRKCVSSGQSQPTGAECSEELCLMSRV